jgi:hypothetical protein
MGKKVDKRHTHLARDCVVDALLLDIAAGNI